MADCIQVIGVRAGTVALWEQHLDHPGGEAYVTADQVTEVTKTPRVMAALRAGSIVEVPAETETAPEEKPKSRRKKAGNDE